MNHNKIYIALLEKSEWQSAANVQNLELKRISALTANRRQYDT